MSSSDFRQLVIRGEAGKADRLFRAAVSAFCSLTRPSRREVDQLEDLALPLFDAVSVETKRFAAAALSECAHAPAVLIRRLCDETVDIAAPLLIRSAALTDVDLIALIGRHGLPHARAIARRPGLNQTISDLVQALSGSGSQSDAPGGPQGSAQHAASNDTSPAAPKSETERTLSRLRAMMRPATAPAGADDPSTARQKADADDFAKLLATALCGNRAFFQTALADLLEVRFQLAKSLTENTHYTSLIPALRALELPEEQAFLLVAALFPLAVNGAAAIRVFLDHYRLCNVEAAREWLRAHENDAPAGQPLSSAL
ncbi:Uncharacterized conserved protein, DUF2336 family [Mesorhizobium albiziae]|uniref:Uncharacterized conserved protein, DUF2336 family n=1 Tax=Neomesorhizobium albiziae TaxID=335020 RepID=A0A1I4AJH0_9HYPH|nr:DUF2336 domain-containing protein [Mesorhizobium albiziae]GLS32907.1 hypothetical protein GCM10007937_46170 [Mesorhizobium albiziae]SFK56618.1 Uncharacterized conserved protein, DUF2336 family [Mesorhizobium albiziae]